jgi:hypothetical protein
VLIVEYWTGVACVCPHRCEKEDGTCTLTVQNVAETNEKEFGDAFFATLDQDYLLDAMQALQNSDEEDSDYVTVNL